MELCRERFTQGGVLQEEGGDTWPTLDSCPLGPNREAPTAQSIYE